MLKGGEERVVWNKKGLLIEIERENKEQFILKGEGSKEQFIIKGI